MLASDAPAADGRKRVSIGVIRPSRLLKFTGQPDVLSPMRWVETLSWDSWLTPGGAVEGELDVRMSTDAIRR